MRVKKYIKAREYPYYDTCDNGGDIEAIKSYLALSMLVNSAPTYDGVFIKNLPKKKLDKSIVIIS